MISEHLKRFILTSIDSIPHLEAILALRYSQDKSWNSAMLAETLYINEKKADGILEDLCNSHVIAKDGTSGFHYQPVSLNLSKTIDQLADIYAKNLIEVTNLIHSKTDKQAQQFGDAFKWPGKDT